MPEIHRVRMFAVVPTPSKKLRYDRAGKKLGYVTIDYLFYP